MSSPLVAVLSLTLFRLRFESTPSVANIRNLSTLAVSMALLDSYFVIFWTTNTFQSERDSDEPKDANTLDDLSVAVQKIHRNLSSSLPHTRHLNLRSGTVGLVSQRGRRRKSTLDYFLRSWVRTELS